jgi:hypothetical protein
MRTIGMSVLACLCCLSWNRVQANTADDFRDAQRIVVVTEDEGIVYAQFCGFYELRDLLAESVSSPARTFEPAGLVLFEVTAIGREGETVAQVGDHWISTSDGSALLTSETFGRLMQLVDDRKGQGIPKAKVPASNQRALEHIQDPAYIEQNLCGTS